MIDLFIFLCFLIGALCTVFLVLGFLSDIALPRLRLAMRYRRPAATRRARP